MKVVVLLMMMLALFTGAIAFADDADDTIGLLIGVLKDTADPAAQADLLKGMNAAMEGKRNVKMPSGWQDVYAKLIQSPNEEVRKQGAKLAAIFGDAGTLEAMKNVVLDPKKPADERSKALESLIGKNDPGLATLLQGLVKDPALAEPALKGLAGTDDAKTPAVILAAY